MKITVTVSGPPASGKSLVTNQIAKALKGIGLENVKLIEKEMSDEAVADRIDRPSKYVMAINTKNVEIEIVEVWGKA